MSRIVGIDLGTTNSAVAVIDESGRPQIVHNRDGKNVTPSCVSEKDGVVEVGDFALKTWGDLPENAAARFKRSMGSDQKFDINGKQFSATELSALVLKKLVQDAEGQIGKIEEAVVTIPANFAHEAREATMAAARAAGLKVNYIINEPTAAALYYAFKMKQELDGNYAVYDLGGGTFDVTVIKAKGSQVEVLSTNGVSKLGGDDFDNALINIVKKKYRAVTNEDLDVGDYSRNDAEEDKKVLSARDKTTRKIGKHLIVITKNEFEESISSLIAQAEMLCESTVEEANLSMDQIKGVFLVGGSTRIPQVKESVKNLFKREPESSVNVDEVVALGAALYAGIKSASTKLTDVQRQVVSTVAVEEVTSKCFGTIIVSHDDNRDQSRLINTVLIKKGDKIPCSTTEVYHTVHDGQRNVQCKVTESTSTETDPRFVKIVWEGSLPLPPDRPAGQAVRVTFSYDDNQIMKCSFHDVASGKETKVDLSMATANKVDAEKIRKFMVE